MAKKFDKKQKKFSIYSLFGKVGDFLFIPVLVLSLFSSISMLVQRKQNKPTSFFNISLVNILSHSMTDAGFLKGDTVITVKSSPQNIELGDVIAFYRYTDPLDKSTRKEKIVWYGYNNGDYLVNTNTENIYGKVEGKKDLILSLEKKARENEKTVKDAQKAKSSIIFHMVIGIYHDDYGNVFYRTKGTNNSSYDTHNGLSYVRSDFVVGKYTNTPRFVRDVMTFCATTRGMIILVCIPLSILVLFQCLSIIKQIEIMNLERQLINGKRKFYDEEIKVNLNGNTMEIYNKAILYTLVLESERANLMQFMWGNVIGGNKISKKEKRAYMLALEANKKIDISNKAYFQVWINGTKGYIKKKIKKYFENKTLSLILSNTNLANGVNNELKVNKTINLEEQKDKLNKKQKIFDIENIANLIEMANKDQKNIKNKNKKG